MDIMCQNIIEIRLERNFNVLFSVVKSVSNLIITKTTSSYKSLAVNYLIDVT